MKFNPGQTMLNPEYCYSKNLAVEGNFKRENLSNLIPRNSGLNKVKTSTTPLNRLNSRDMRLKEFRLKTQARNRAKANKNIKNK